jgi:hypothetical protein
MKRTKRSLKAKLSKPAMLAALLAMAISGTGCSWIFMDRAPADPETEDLIDCSGIGWPVIDTIFAVGSLVYAGAQLHGVANYDPDGNGIYSGFSKGTLLALGITNLVWALIHGASAGTGFCWANTCREAQLTRTRWLKTRRSASQMKLLETSIQKARHPRLYPLKP